MEKGGRVRPASEQRAVRRAAVAVLRAAPPLGALMLVAALSLATGACASAQPQKPAQAGSGGGVTVVVFNNTRYMADAQILCGGVPQRVNNRLPTGTQWTAMVPPDACGPTIEVLAHYQGNAYSTGPITVGGTGTVNVTINYGRLDYTVGH